MNTLWAFLLAIGPLILIHELGHFLVAKWKGVRVERFSLGYPPRLFGFRRGDTDYCVSAVPLGGYVKMAGENPEEPGPGAPDEFGAQPPGARALIIVAGPLANLVLAFLVYVAVLGFGGQAAVTGAGLTVGELSPGWPAEQAGLRPGDRILAVDARPVADFDDLVSRVRGRVGDTLRFEVLRGTDTVTLDIVPRSSPNPETGEAEGKIGFYPQVAYRPVGWRGAIQGGAAATWRNTVMVLHFFGRFVSGRESVRNIGGPLFIASVAGQVADQGWRSFLAFMALLSINLTILNVLPIPVLDGGHLLFILIEGVRRKPLSMNQRIRIQQVGLAVLLVLIIFVTINDLVRVLS